MNNAMTPPTKPSPDAPGGAKTGAEPTDELGPEDAKYDAFDEFVKNLRDPIQTSYERRIALAAWLKASNWQKSQECPKTALATIGAAMLADLDYAWSWHCNIAMACYDAGARPHEACNEGAARFVALLFPGVDTTKHVGYAAILAQPSEPTPAPSVDDCRHVYFSARRKSEAQHATSIGIDAVRDSLLQWHARAVAGLEAERNSAKSQQAMAEMEVRDVVKLNKGHVDQIARLTAQLAEVTKERDGLKAGMMEIYDKTCVHHTDEDRRQIRCPVCLKNFMQDAMNFAEAWKQKCNEYSAEIATLKAGGWVAVADQLPPDNSDVLAWVGDDDGEGDVHIVMTRTGSDEPHFGKSRMESLGVTHWMPLPSAPLPSPAVEEADTSANSGRFATVDEMLKASGASQETRDAVKASASPDPSGSVKTVCREGEKPKCPHGNVPTGNWCGIPPNVVWESKLPCCGVAFSGENPQEAAKKYADWMTRVNPSKWQAEREAFARGEKVQFRYLSDTWQTFDGPHPNFESPLLKWRVKPAPESVAWSLPKPPEGAEDCPTEQEVVEAEPERVALGPWTSTEDFPKVGTLWIRGKGDYREHLVIGFAHPVAYIAATCGSEPVLESAHVSDWIMKECEWSTDRVTWQPCSKPKP